MKQKDPSQGLWLLDLDSNQEPGGFMLKSYRSTY